MNPTDLRQHYRSLRRSLPREERTAASQRVADSVGELLSDRPVGDIGSYVAADGELDLLATRQLLEPLGWRFLLPVVGSGHSMTFRVWTGSSRMITNRFGTPEPDAGSTQVEPADLDVVLMPCVSVDRQGNRLGMGGGYYDRAFAGPGPGPLRIAVAFDVQLHPLLPANEWDVPAHIVVTESGVIFAGRDRR